MADFFLRTDLKGTVLRMEKKANHIIGCTVEQCANNCGNGFCSLEKVQIGTHESNPTVSQCVDCESFVLGNRNCCK